MRIAEHLLAMSLPCLGSLSLQAGILYLLISYLDPWQWKIMGTTVYVHRASKAGRQCREQPRYAPKTGSTRPHPCLETSPFFTAFTSQMPDPCSKQARRRQCNTAQPGLVLRCRECWGAGGGRWGAGLK
ncbi:hypothetical protein BGZ63DRAFT_182790 [Mariannaea sp. PMI_226]|nr:hypothetical protein BGZ63DRAFT_182790 [Mariannaea sp. PMI_226]